MVSGQAAEIYKLLIVGPRQVERVAFFLLKIISVCRSTRVAVRAPHVFLGEALVPQL